MCIEAFRLHEVEPDKIAADSLGEVMRCPGANPTQAELKAITGSTSTRKRERKDKERTGKGIIVSYYSYSLSSSSYSLSDKATISLSEFLAVMDRTPLHEDPKGAMKDAFSIFDVSGTGKVDASELRQVLGNLAERFTVNEGKRKRKERKKEKKKEMKSKEEGEKKKKKKKKTKKKKKGRKKI